MSWFIRFCTSSVGKKYIMAVTGLMLVSFLFVHAVGNSSIFLGRDAFISYAHHLHSLGPLVPLAEITLLSIFLLHVSFAVSLFWQNWQARSDRYAVTRSAGGRTWGSRTMPYSGVVVLLFILIHLLNVRFIEHSQPVADTVRIVLGNPLLLILYIIGICGITLHISHGIWSLLQSLGMNHPRYENLISMFNYFTSVLLAFLFFAVVFTFACFH